MAQEVVGRLERIERKLDLVVRLLARNEVRAEKHRRKQRSMRRLIAMAETEPPPFLPPED